MAFAFSENGEEGQAIGVARCYREAAKTNWGEVGFIVVDDWQGSGVGTALLKELSQRCISVGIEYWKAQILGENTAAVRLLDKAGDVQNRYWEDRCMVLEITLAH
jgi:RimJ/RimL family protein N-acetyltransferase